MTEANSGERCAGHDPLQEKISALHDDVMSFKERCTTLCTLLAALAASEQGADSGTVEGLRSLSTWLNARVMTLSRRIESLRIAAADL